MATSKEDCGKSSSYHQPGFQASFGWRCPSESSVEISLGVI